MHGTNLVLWNHRRTTKTPEPQAPLSPPQQGLRPLLLQTGRVLTRVHSTLKRHMTGSSIHEGDIDMTKALLDRIMRLVIASVIILVIGVSC